MSCSPEPYSHSENKAKVDLNLSNYATKSDLKIVTSVHSSNFAEVVNLANFKSDVNEFKNVPSDLNTLKTVLAMSLILANLSTKQIIILKDIEDKMNSITNLTITAPLSALEIMIANIGTLVEKASYVEKIKEIEGKYFTTCDYNNFTNNIIDAKIKIKN